ncbi:carboxylating nicotinate-nucleotide diphosphorylase [bacterium]|nr:carboxylating nicotinate-nucleotide diphosphorylase [bacterium]
MNWVLAERIIRAALDEDLGYGDITTELTPGRDKIVTATFIVKQDGVLCGGPVAERCFTLIEPAAEVSFSIAEGDEIKAGTALGKVRAKALTILSAERVALNFLQRMSGIATVARRLARQAGPNSTIVVETRKTTPGLRLFEKHAVRVGGGYNHRMGLDGAVMLKDNHFALAGGDPAELVRAVRDRVSHTMKVIAEAGRPEMVEPLTAAGADVVLLDNFTPEQVRRAVEQIAGRALIEVSGGITEENFAKYLVPGVEAISMGALTHSVKALDISLELGL